LVCASENHFVSLVLSSPLVFAAPPGVPPPPPSCVSPHLVRQITIRFNVFNHFFQQQLPSLYGMFFRGWFVNESCHKSMSHVASRLAPTCCTFNFNCSFPLFSVQFSFREGKHKRANLKTCRDVQVACNDLTHDSLCKEKHENESCYQNAHKRLIANESSFWSHFSSTSHLQLICRESLQMSRATKTTLKWLILRCTQTSHVDLFELCHSNKNIVSFIGLFCKRDLLIRVDLFESCHLYKSCRIYINIRQCNYIHNSPR